MSLLRALAGMVGDTMVPDGTVVRNRTRVTIDRILTLLITLLAVALAVGYQVLGRWGHLIFDDE